MDFIDASSTAAGVQLHTQSLLIEIFKEEGGGLVDEYNLVAQSQKMVDVSMEKALVGNHRYCVTDTEGMRMSLTGAVEVGALSSTGAKSLHRKDIQIQIEGLREEIIKVGTVEGQIKPAWAVHEQIGKGGFGVVYRGTWRGLEVAIKRIVLQV